MRTKFTHKDEKGYSLVDLLVSTLLVSLVLAGTLKNLAIQTEIQVREDLSMMLDQNLRMGMDKLTDHLRASGDGVPTENLSSWVSWVSGFSENPSIDDETDSSDELTLARCSSVLVAELNTAAAKDVSHLILRTSGTRSVSQTVNTQGHRLILIGDTEVARVSALAGHEIDIDTDPTTHGLQGLSRGYPSGTPICVIEVTTFKVVPRPHGRSLLVEDDNDSYSWTSIAEGITDMQIDAVENGRRYDVTLTATSDAGDPLSGERLTRTMTSSVHVRNADTVD